MESKYHINLDIKYGYSTLIDIPALVKQTKEQWFNQTLCRINDCVARLGIIQGEFHWHKHDNEDEFFLVLEGKLVIELKDHPWFVGVQFHPELKSRPIRSHPLFRELVAVSKKLQKGKSK